MNLTQIPPSEMHTIKFLSLAEATEGIRQGGCLGPRNEEAFATGPADITGSNRVLSPQQWGHSRQPL